MERYFITTKERSKVTKSRAKLIEIREISETKEITGETSL